MKRSWSDFAKTPAYEQLSDQEKQEAQQHYYEKYLYPTVAGTAQEDAAREEFFRSANPTITDRAIDATKSAVSSAADFAKRGINTMLQPGMNLDPVATSLQGQIDAKGEAPAPDLSDSVMAGKDGAVPETDPRIAVKAGAAMNSIMSEQRPVDTDIQKMANSIPQMQPEGAAEIAGNALARGVKMAHGVNKSIVGLGLDAVGADQMALDWLKSAVATQNESANYPAAVKDFTEIKDWSDVPTYALEGVLENAPMLAESIMGGGVGAVAAQKLGREAVEGMVADAARKELAKRTAIGAAAGAGASSIGMESGSIYSDIYQETGEMRPGVAAVFGTLAGAIDAIPAARAVTTALKKPLVEAATDTLIKRYGVEGAKQILEEGGTEFLQTWIEKGAVSYVDGRELINHENLIESIDAMLKGGAAGGVTHVAAQGYNDLASRGQNPQAIPQADPAGPGDINPVAAESIAPSAQPEPVKPQGTLSRAADVAAQYGLGVPPVDNGAIDATELYGAEPPVQSTPMQGGINGTPDTGSIDAAGIPADTGGQTSVVDQGSMADPVLHGSDDAVPGGSGTSIGSADPVRDGTEGDAAVAPAPTFATAKEGDVVESGGTRFRKTSNGFERIESGDVDNQIEGSNSVVSQNGQSVDDNAHAAATSPTNDLAEPTEAQKQAGNYKKGKINVGGLNISVENPSGSERSGTDRSGKPWQTQMQDHYGYVTGVVAKAKDKDHVDVFVKPGTTADYAGDVYVVDQKDPDTGHFDEPKVMIGYGSQEEAEAAYDRNYHADWQGKMNVTRLPMSEFKARLQDPQAFVKPQKAAAAPAIEQESEVITSAGSFRPLVESLVKRRAAANQTGKGKIFDKAMAQAKAVLNGEEVAPKAFKNLAVHFNTADPETRQILIQMHDHLGEQTKAAKPKKQDRRALLEEHFAPGNIIKSDYWGTYDRVKAFDWNDGNWNVTVEHVEKAKNNTWKSVEHPRKHSTMPDKHDVVVERAPKAEAQEPAVEAAQAKPSEHVESTAPEHAAQGVDDRELGEIVAEFNAAQESMVEGDDKVTHVFDAPAKSEIIRLNDKVKVYNKEHGWMTPAEAKERIAEWKERTAAQGKDPKTRSANSQKVVLSLFDLTGKWSQPWEEAGYQVYRFDIQADPDVGDVNNFSTEFFGDWFGDFDGMDIYAILAACPCTDFAVSGARHFAAKDADGRTVKSVKLVHQTLATIEYFKPAVWAIENPVGRIEELGGLPPWRLSFDPNHLGDPYTKKTLLWGRFNADLPIAPVEPTEGSKMHAKYGGKSLATKNARSATPEGFSYGFFLANNAHDNPAMAIANKYDRLDRKLIEQAVKAGVSEAQIDEAVEDFYYMDLDDEAANDAIRELLPQTPDDKNRKAADRLDQLVAVMEKTDDKRFFSRNTPETSAKHIVRDVVAELRKDRTSTDVVGLLETASSRLMRQYGAFSQVIDEVIDTLAPKSSVSTAPAKQEPSKPVTTSGEKFTNNKVFTADKVDAARARLKKKLGALNSGLDPELMVDGMTIAGAYIESGVRDFSSYAKAMADDFGDVIKPYLLSFYEAVRSYPGINKEGMTPAADAAQQHQALLTPAVKEIVKEVMGEGVQKVAKARPKQNGQMTLTQDWGVDHIDGWTESATGKNQGSDFGLIDGIKDQFLNETKKYLNQAAKLLEEEGYTPYNDRKGKPMKAVSVSEGGTAVSGDVSLTMRRGNVGVYATIGASSLRGMVGNHPQGIVIMARVTGSADSDQYATRGTNTWLSSDINATELASKLADMASIYIGRTQNQQDYGKKSEQEAENADTLTTQNVSRGGTEGDIADRADRDSAGEPVDAGLAGARQGSDSDESVRSGIQQPVGAGTGRTGVSEEQRAPIADRDRANGRPVTGAAEQLDHTIEDADQIGKGGLGQKYRDNIAAIKIIKAIEAENRNATADERKQLAKYVGWGALKGVFDAHNKSWAKQHKELRELLNDDEWASARASVLNAHYTSPAVVKAMYEAAGQLGFKAGRILEPSMGSGNFFGLMPAAMRSGSKLHGVELDNLTSRLARALYPNAVIATSTGFQDYQVPNGYFDMAIGNPPFGSEPIVDRERNEYSGFSIHNYFIARMLDKVRDGGIVPVIVSHNFLDALNSKSREWVAQRANLIAAVRLPNTAFQENAGTEVVTDILFFQKTATPEKSPAWVNASDIDVMNPKTGEKVAVNVNDYFVANPRNVLGKHSAGGSMYGANEYTVEPDGRDIDDALTGFINDLPAGIYQPVERRAEDLDSADNTVPDGVKPGSFYVNDSGEIRQRGNDVAGMKTSQAWAPKNDGELRRMKGMIQLRELLRAQMRMERDPMAPEAAIESGRKALNKAYDAFVKANGYVNSQTNRRIFLDDTEAALVQALEFDYDPGVSKAKAESTGMEEKKPSAKKADIMERRVLFPPSEVMNVNNAKDALLASLNNKGRVDLAYMAELYGKPEKEIITELGDVVFFDPVQEAYVHADEYLSGDVKTKLAEAESAAEGDATLKRNVEALKKIIPADRMPSEIYAAMGAAWIPRDVYSAFAKEITGSDAIDVAYLGATAQWLTSNEGRGDLGKMTSEFGTDKMNSFEIFALMMNGRPVEVKKREPDGKGGYRSVTDEEATEAARQRMEKIKALWESWVWGDGERASRLAGIFNDKHNRTVARRYDGSHLTFPGMSPALSLRPHQKDLVWRALQDRNVLLDHVVGAGKTYAMVATVMEMRRLAISRKPIFVVPNHLTLQWRSDFSRAYPGANVLAATPEDFSKDNRERLFSKIATGDYDAVVIGHSSLKKVGLDLEIEQRMYEEQVEEIADAIEEIKRDRGDRGIVRDMEKIKKNLEAKVQELINKAGARDKVLTFDELGIDALFVDEMHEFKNLFFTTQKQRVSGLGNPKGSGKAFDLFMKVRWMQESLGERVPFVTATGTPVSNSLSEMFTMQRYMRFDELRRDGLHLFDAWSRMYGEDEYVYEVAPSGVGYRISQRFSKFKNLPSLMGHYRSFADVVTLQDLKDQAAADGKRFPVPKIKGGRQQNIVAQRSDLQRDFFGVPQIRKDEAGNIAYTINDPARATIEQNAQGQWILKADSYYSMHQTREDAEINLVEQAMTPILDLDPESLVGQFNNLKELTRKTKGKINALSLTGLANKAGLDYRLIDPDAPDFEGSKINKAVDRMMDTYRQWSADKGTQLVFCDLSVPLSARGQAASKEKRLYVLDESGMLTHKKGTLHTVQGREGFPFYLVRDGKGDKATVIAYEPVSGAVLRRGFADKKAAQEWVSGFLDVEENRDKWFDARERFEPITPERIAEYRDERELEVDEDGSNEISADDLEAIAGSSQFSVYDDIRTKLIAKGVPAHEIAFIHDYNTPKQKQELFKRVNRGDVRFLFGSTPKLGAGTNVQERLVGLHHIDAPWRPSDLEQREGRIIRQGNKLYERDPDGFEVFIGRYATEQTYDTRRWQLLEHKASGIEQLRKYSGEIEIEDVSSEAANAADMKAAASGNPLILEETKLRTEVKRLAALQRAHADGKYAMQRTLEHNRRLIDTYLPEKIDTLERLVATAEKHPIPDDKEAIALTIVDGRRATGNEHAEELIGLLSVKVRESGEVGYQKPIQYRGMEFSFRRPSETGWLQLHSPLGQMGIYSPKEKVSPSGVITRMNNWISNLPSRIEEAKQDIREARTDVSSIEQRINDPFEEAQQLEDTKLRHAEVQRALMKSTQMDAVPTEERAKFVKELEQRKKMLEGMGYEKAVKEATREMTAFSRGDDGAALPTKATQAIVDAIRAKWDNAPEIVVVSDMDDSRIRNAVRNENERQLSQGASGQPEGFFDAGKVYIVAGMMKDPKDVVRVLLHETLGHYGLRGTFGPKMAEILDQIYMARRQDVLAKAKQYGLDFTKQGDRRMAAEEVLAEMAQVNPQLGFVKRAIAVIRSWLRANVPGFDKMKMTDAEIVREILEPARRFVEAGSAKDVEGESAMSRSKGWAGFPDAVIGHRSVSENDNYRAAKSGDMMAAMILASETVTDDYADRVKAALGDSEPVIVPVRSAEGEQGVSNAIPAATALVLGEKLGLQVDSGRIRQAHRIGRSGSDGWHRLANQPAFEGNVVAGQDYLILDDTLTQGGTLAQLKEYIESNGGRVVLASALTGKGYSAKIALSDELLGELRAKHGGLELWWKDTFGFGFEGLTESEARFIAKARGVSTEQIRERIAGARVGRANGSRPGNDPQRPSDQEEVNFSRSTGATTPTKKQGGLLDRTLQTLGGNLFAETITQPLYRKAAQLIDSKYLLGNRAGNVIKAGIVADYGLDQQYLDRRDEIEARMNAHMRKSKKLIQNLAGLSREESRIAYQWLQEKPDSVIEDELMAQLPMESRTYLEQVKRMIDDMSQEAIALGQLTPEQYERNKFAYLHRSYAKHEFTDDVLENKIAQLERASEDATDEEERKRLQREIGSLKLNRKVSSRRSANRKILGDQYRGRGLQFLVDPDRLDSGGDNNPIEKGQKYVRLERRDENGVLTKRVWWNSGVPVPPIYKDMEADPVAWEVRGTKDGKIMMWRDFTKDERERMGELDEAKYAIATTVSKMAHDIETGKFFSWVQATYAKEEPPEDAVVVDDAGDSAWSKGNLIDALAEGAWVKVPETKVPQTQVARYGALAGMYVPGSVWNDIRQIANPPSVPRWYQSLMRLWKISKTALSPAVHTNNVMANIVMADMHDVQARHVVKALEAMWKARKDPESQEFIERFEDSGAIAGTYVHAELKDDMMKPLLDELRREMIAGQSPLDQMYTVANAMSMIFGQREIRKGMNMLAMTKPGKVATALPDLMIEMYQSEDVVFRLAAFIKGLEEGKTDREAGRNARKAFLDYRINAPWIQGLRHTVLPFVAFTYRMIPMYVETIRDKPWKLAKYMMVANALAAIGMALAGIGDDEDEEIQKLLPDDQKGVTPYLTQRQIPIGRSEDGRPVYLDVTRWMPLGDIFEVRGESSNTLPLPGFMYPSGVIVLMGELMTNRSLFSGRDIWQETDTGMEASSKMFNHIYKGMAPNLPLLPGTYSWDKVGAAVTGKTDQMGREFSMGQALASSMGVKLNSYDTDLLRYYASVDAENKVREIRGNINRMARDYSRNGISEEDLQDSVTNEQDKLREVAEDLQERLN
jgi:N12 class adenine-specific DNA methylase